MDYLQANKEFWNKRTGFHVLSSFYDVPSFLEGRSSLNSIELDLLGDVEGKSVLHLQCHFGQDSISLARMGAHVTGVDLSDAAIKEANHLAQQCNIACRFIESDVYELPSKLNEQFDIVFSSYGTIGWLPDMEKWAAVITQYLKPGGMFVFAEFHPVVWMYDNDFTKVQYSYFKGDAIIEEESGTYADRSAQVQASSITWNHSLSEVINALIQNGLQLKIFREFNYSPYNCFRHSKETEKNKFIIEPFGNKIPLVYALQMTR